MFADKEKLMFTNSGESVYLYTDKEFIQYVSDHLGQDFADCLQSCIDTHSCPELLEELYDACLEISTDEVCSKNPILRIKNLRKYAKLLNQFKDVLEDILYTE